MVVFIKNSHYKSGMYRVAESLASCDVKLVTVNNIEETDKYQDFCAIFGGFYPRELQKNTSIKHKYYLFCSPFGQADLSSQDFYSIETQILFELIYFISLNVIENAVTQSKSLVDRFGFHYLPPHMFNIESVSDFNHKINYFTLHRKNYGFLGNNSRKHRNVMNQLAAISELSPKEEIVVRNVKDYQNYAKLFNCQFVDKDLKSDASYMEEISTHRLGFLCSWSEAFSYQALEYASVGVPVIHSPCVDWYPPCGKENTKVENIDRPSEIRAKAQYWLDEENMYNEFSYKLVEWFKVFNKEQRNLLFEAIEELRNLKARRTK